MSIGLLYYTCNTHHPLIETACRSNLNRIRGNLELGCVSREPTPFGDWNIVVNCPRSAVTMHRQIVAGLERVESDYVFLIESDVVYDQSHLTLTPERDDTFYYNTNVWRIRYPDGHAVWTDDLQQVSGVCAHKELLLDFYTQRLVQLESGVFNRHYEPGIRQSVGSRLVENWQSRYPNLCIRHNNNLTQSKWSPDEFRNKRFARGWKETDEPIESWGQLSGRFEDFLKNL